MDLALRALVPDDYDALVALWAEAGLPYRPRGRDRREAIEAQMSRDPGLFLGAFRGDRLVGSVIATFEGRKGWINRLAVLPSERRKGVARILVSGAEEALRRRGALVLAALVEADNGPSLALFQACGYTPHHDVLYLSKRESEDV